MNGYTTRKALVLLLLGLFLSGCSKWDYKRIGFTTVITIGAIEVGSNSAFLIGDIENIREDSIVESGFVLSSPSVADANLRLDQAGVLQVLSPRMETISQDRAFAARATGLSSSTEYIFRAYVKIRNEDQVVYGIVDRFTTGDLAFFINSIRGSGQGCPTTAVAEIQFDGSISGGSNLIQLVYSDDVDNRTPTIENGIVVSGDPIGPMGRTEIEWDVSCDQSYFVRAVFGVVGANVSYSEVYAFSTHEGGIWISIENYPDLLSTSGESCPNSFTTDSHGYVGGKLTSDPATTVLWRFDPESGWHQLQNPSFGVSGNDILLSCAFAIVDAPRVITWHNAFIEYFPKTDSWVQIADDFNPDFPAPPRWPFSFEFSNQLYFGTGFNEIHEVYGNSVFRTRLDGISNSEEIGEFPGVPRHRTVFFKVDNIGYVGLGETEFGVLINDFWSFNLESESWNEIESFPEEINSHVGLSMKGKGYVLTGSDKYENPNPGFWEYDPTLNVWSRLTDFGHGDGNADVGFAINGVIYGGLGISATGEQRREFWRYVPEL